MASQVDDDLQASTTEGFKVGEKKTVEEYAKLGECHLRLASIVHIVTSMAFYVLISVTTLSLLPWCISYDYIVADSLQTLHMNPITKGAVLRNHCFSLHSQTLIRYCSYA